MGTIFHIMKEEYDRLIQADKAYQHTIQQLPKGTPRIKKIHSRDYLYLARREGSKVVYDYIGNVESEKAQKIFDLLKKRNRITEIRKGIQRDLKEVRKVLRGKI